MDSKFILNAIEKTIIAQGFNEQSFIKETMIAIKKRKQGEPFSFSMHLEAFVFAQLSNQRTWGPIVLHKDEIKTIFKQFSKIEILKSDTEDFVNELKQLKCGNRAIRKQMQVLKENIRMFEKIEQEYQSLDYFVASDQPILIAKLLSCGRYKMKQMGVPLAMEYLKNVGIDTSKPDVHICRILSSNRLGFSKNSTVSECEAVHIIQQIARETKRSEIEIDAILWQFCAVDYGNVCGALPKCDHCGLKEICHYQIK